VDINSVASAFKPLKQPFELIDYNNVFATDQGSDIFDTRGIARSGAIVVVRPDQYVAHVLPLDATDALAAFFRGVLVP
jgi:phenol 2-monooxygenase